MEIQCFRMASLEQGAAGVSREFDQAGVVRVRFAPAAERGDHNAWMMFAQIVEMIRHRKPDVIAGITVEFFQ